MGVHPSSVRSEQVSSAIVIPATYPDGLVIDWHQHDFHQLVYACSGVMTVETVDNLWVIPPQRAVWVTAGVLHKVSMHGKADLHNLYVNSAICHALPKNCCVFTISPLLLVPEDNRSLSGWADYINISSRSLSRLFRTELGVSFVEYRQQVRLFQALKYLASGASVTTVAMEVGFSSLSAFNRLFKRYFGTTPGHFFAG